jgi:outer membrane autotransporter protein
MNLLHKIVWSCVRQQYIVTSELARGRTKSASSSTARSRASLIRALTPAVAVLGAGMLLPGLAAASSCKTGTAGQGAPVGGACQLSDYNPPGSNNGVGQAVVNNGQTVTLKGTAAIGSGWSGVSTVPASQLNVVSGSFDNSQLLTGNQDTPVAVLNKATGTNDVFRVFNSSSIADQSNMNLNYTQFQDVGQDQYFNASFGRVAKSGGTLNVNIGDTPTGAPSSNSITMVAKQSYLTSADGTGNALSTVTWKSRNQIDLGIDPGLATPDAVNGTLSVDVPVTTYAGAITFNGKSYQVNNAAQLAAYNNVLIQALKDGVITTQSAYDAAFNKAFNTQITQVVYKTDTTAGDPTRIPQGDRYAILARGANGRANVAAGGQIDITNASGAVKLTDGARGTNNGTLSGNTIVQVVQVESGSSFTNSATGVVSSGYMAGDKFNTASGDPSAYYTGNGINATDAGTKVTNNGVVNTAGFAYLGNTSYGIGVANGAAATNNGIINAGVNPDYATTVVGARVSGGSSFTNSASGQIYIGRAAQYSLADPTVDVHVSAPTYGVAIMDTGDSAINAGTITIGSLTENAVAMYSTAPVSSTLLNNGTININGAAGSMPLTNIGIMADDNGADAAVVARNAGTINVNGVNGVGIKVNADPGIDAHADSTGTINVNGNADPASGTRNFGVWVDGAGGVATVGGNLNLNGTGAIGAFAQDGGTINVAASAVPKFSGGTDQIGFFASGKGSTINVDAKNLTVNTDRSTMFRVADGATYTGSSSAGPLALTISGTDARGVVATGLGTTLSTGTSTYDVTGAAGSAGGAVALVAEGGATGTINAGTTINLANAGAIAGIVDGQGHDLTGAALGIPQNTSLVNDAAIQSGTAGTTGFVARNLGTLVNNASIQLNGANSNGVVIGARGTVQNNATIRVANGNGALVQGAQAMLANNGTIQADDGVAAVHLTGAGASVAFSGAGLISAGGTADGILVDSTATNGSVTGMAGNIVVNGSGKALDNRAAGATISLSNTTLTLNGAGAVGVDSTGNDSRVTLNGGTVTTAGPNGAGVHIGSNGTLNMSGATITTTGAGSHAIVIDSGATGSLSGGTVTANGNGAYAAYVQGPDGKLTVNGTALTSTASNGVTTDAGGTLALTGAKVKGATSGIAVTDALGNKQVSTITVDGGSVGATSGSAIAVNGARANITVGGGAQVTSGSRTLFNVTNGSAATLTANGVALTGNAYADASSTATLTLANGATLTGMVDPMSVNVGSSSTWTVTGSSVVDTLVNQNAVVFQPPVGNPAAAASYKTITANNYVGAGSVLLNTYVAGDGAPSDRLIINGGTATGQTKLVVQNTGGKGARTTGNGINVVGVQNGGTTGATAFTLGNTVQAGAYQYFLYRGGEGDPNGYYLRSTLDGTPDGPAATRPGVAGYTMTPALNVDYGFASLGRLQERVGDIASTEKVQPDNNKGGVWARAVGMQQTLSNGRYSTDDQQFFFQAGKDWTLSKAPDGGSTHAGVTASLGSGDAQFYDHDRNLAGLSSKTGSATLQAQTLGGYYTKYWQDGSYWDSVAQVARYENKYKDVGGGSGDQTGYGLALSQEVGKPFMVTPSIALEPQAQLMYQYINLDGFNDSVSKVGGYSTNALRGRLGVRAFIPNIGTSDKTGFGTPYLTLDVLHDFVPLSNVTVGGSSFSPSVGRTWGEVGGGLSMAINKRSQFYAAVKYQKNLGGDERQGVFAQVGYRYSW